MVRFYKWGDDVPSWLVKVTAGHMPSVKFGGLIVIYKWKGDHVVKMLIGKHIIKVSDGAQVHFQCNNVIFKAATTPLSIFMRIRYFFARR